MISEIKQKWPRVRFIAVDQESNRRSYFGVDDYDYDTEQV